MDDGRVEPLGTSGRPAAFTGVDFLFHCVACVVFRFKALFRDSASYMRSL